MTVQQQVRDILTRYCAKLPGQLEILDDALSNRSAVGAPSLTITEIWEITHEMRGTAGSLGFADISAAAAALDDNLKLLGKQDGVSAAELRVSKTLFARLREIASQATPQKSKLYDADLSMAASGTGSTAPPRTAV